MEEEEGQAYQLVNAEGETVKTSRHYNGKGQATYPNNDVYDGYFVEGLREGPNGTYTYADKGDQETDVRDTYKGAWKNNKKHGIGQQVYFNVGVYNGYWENGLRNGEGVMIYQNQDVYSGQWKAGKKEGKGTYVFNETGQKYVGQFKSGQLVSGKWTYPNGSHFEGSFDNNKPKGHGKWIFENKNVVEGDYTQIKRADVDNDNEIKLTWKTSSDDTVAPQ